MSQPITHLNLLQRAAPSHAAAWALAGLMAVALVGTSVRVSQARAGATEAVRQRDDVAQQLKDVQARIAVQNGEQIKSAKALALRKEADALQPQARSAQALIEAVRQADSGRTDEFARPLVAMTGVGEPGLWLTAMTVSGGGKRLELQGQARDGGSVLRFARRVNEALQPLALKLGSLELQPVAAGATAADGSPVVPGAAAVTFRLN